MPVVFVAWAMDGNKLSAKSMCKTAPKSLFWPSLAYQDLSMCRDWPVKKAIVNLPIKLEIHVNKIRNTFPVSHPLVRDPEQGYQHCFADGFNHC